MPSERSLTDREVKMFNARSDASKHKVIAMQKSDAYVDKEFNGMCYYCNHTRFVTPDQVMICYPCFESKDNASLIIDYVGSRPFNLCLSCGKIHETTAEFTVRSCARCKERIHDVHTGALKHGMDNIHPYFRKLKRQNGKDWELLGGSHALSGTVSQVRGQVRNIERELRR